MPDGKRNSLTAAEDETDNVNCYYDEDSVQKIASSPGKRLPLNVSTRGINSFSDRLLRTMVANEIKKTLEGEDNKKLVAHHRPILHSDNELINGDSEAGNLVVVGVVLNAKQSQNEEVSKALDLLRRNGLTCVCFSLKDGPSTNTNGAKLDAGTASPDENSSAPLELSCDSPGTDKKVSSPTVSTTSDYASPPPPPSPPASQDSSCTSTTRPVLTQEGSVEKDAHMDEDDPDRQRESGVGTFVAVPASTPPPILFPQVPSATDAYLNSDPLRGESEDERGPSLDTDQEIPQIVQKTAAEGLALRRKKRRRRMYPYVSRRKPKNKKKKVVEPEVPKLQLAEEEAIPMDVAVSVQMEVDDAEPSADNKGKLTTVDPYEFDESDNDSTAPLPLDSFKTPIGRSSVNKIELPIKKSGPGSPRKNGVKATTSKGKSSGGSPRKRLTFPKGRAFSPDITESVSRPRRGVSSASPKGTGNNTATSSTELCVQQISADTKRLDTDNDITSEDKRNSNNSNSNSENSLVLPSTKESQPSTSSLAPKSLCDAAIRTDQNETGSPKVLGKPDGETKKELAHSVVTHQPPPRVQMKDNVDKKDVVQAEKNEFIAPPLPSDSLPDTPESMQLRRSSFYSSISRNVRTNLEKYLDGRPHDLLKTPKRSKKFKNGFLLHHGDNFPDDPEAPYRLHLATQVLLKLNKRRVKCKPKEDKGKSLLSYLKLQPKRVSRVSKQNSKQEESEAILISGEDAPSVFSGEWTVPRKYICNICGQVEAAFWDMVMHKGEIHPGIVVTHVELSDQPPEGFRGPQSPRQTTTLVTPPPCSKCGTAFSDYSDLHRHIFDCAGHSSVLEDTTNVAATTVVPARKKKGKRKRGFKKRKINHVPISHPLSLPISIPLEKLKLSSSRRLKLK